MTTMQRVSLFNATLVLGVLLGAASVAPAAAHDETSAAGPLMALLKSGRLPQERIGTVVELVCKRGNAADLRYVYQRCLGPDGYTGKLRLAVLGHLADATANRKVIPQGDLSGLAKLIRPGPPYGRCPLDADRKLNTTAIRLAGLWKVGAAAARLRRVALNGQAPLRRRAQALDALAGIGEKAVLETAETLTAAEHPQQVRFLGVAALCSVDLDQAARIGADVLADGVGTDDPAALMAGFLERKAGSDALAAAVTGRKLPPDVAKLALRYMFSVGRSDAALVAALSRAAGIGTLAKPLSKQEVTQLVAEIIARGDPAGGENVFRRADLSCMKCHALSKAGGNVGPDLSAVGSSSPIEYLVHSILLPNQAVKEQYRASIVVTIAGMIHTGIVVDKSDSRIVLREATGQVKTIPAADVDFEEEGKSLMPQGLVRFLTRRELIDLVRFLSELGKPGEYAIRPIPSIQRWRVLKSVPDELAAGIPNSALFRHHIMDSEGADWVPAYAKVAGGLPLKPLIRATGRPILYVRGEVQVIAAGPIGFRIDSIDGLNVWIDEQATRSRRQWGSNLSRGRHSVTLRIDTSRRRSGEVKVELLKTEGSPAEFTVVGGP